MSRQAIGIGAAANDGTGDPLRTAFTKANDNFSEIYTLLGGDTLTIAGARTALGIGTADSPTFAGVTLGALSTINFTGLTANALLLSDGTYLTQSAKLTFVDPTLTLALGTITTAVGPWAITETRNAAGVTFPGLKYTITDTASAAASLAMQILGGAGGATNLLSLDKAGILTAPILNTGDGSASAVSIQFGARAAYGIFFVSASGWVGFSDNGTVGAAIGSGGVNVKGAGVFGFANTVPGTNAADAGFSRINTATVALGNGSQGSFAGRLKLTSAIAAGVAIASLNASPTTGEVQSVTDALAPALGATVAAGGAAKALVWYNGANWTVIGI